MKLSLCLLGGAMALRPMMGAETQLLAEDVVAAAQPVDFGFFGVVADAAQKGDATPVSTSVKCIMSLCLQYFVILSAVAIGKTIREWQGGKASTALVALQASRGTLHFVPMLAVFILAMRLQFIYYTKGQPDKYGFPPEFMRTSMTTATWVIMFQAVMVLAMPCIGQTPETDEDGNVALSGGDDNSMGKKVFGWLRVIMLVLLQGSILGLLYGCFTLEVPKEVYPNGTVLPPSIMVTANLTQFYFVVYAIMALLKEFGGSKYDSQVGVMNVAVQSLSLAPMMCVLMIAARMRAITLARENPQWWAMYAMKFLGFSMCANVFIVLVGGLAMGAKVSSGSCEGDVSITLENKTFQYCLDIFRTLALFCIYGGVIVILYSLMVLTASKGPTPPLYPATRCVSILTQMYFLCYGGVYIMQVLRGYFGANWGATAMKAFDSARGTVHFAPMLSILFLALRLRAMQNGRNPQGYAQDCMYLCTHAVVIQCLMCLIMGFVSSDVQTDEDGNVKTSGSQAGASRAVLEGLRYTCMAFMYGGSIGIVVAAVTLTRKPVEGEDKLFGMFKIWAPLNPFRIFSVAGVVADKTEAK